MSATRAEFRHGLNLEQKRPPMPLSHTSSSNRTSELPTSPAPDGTTKRRLPGQGLLGSGAAGAAAGGAAFVGAGVGGQVSDPVLQNVYTELEKMLSNSLGTLVGSDTESDDKKSRGQDSQAAQPNGQVPADPSANPQGDSNAAYKALLDNIASGHGGGVFGGLSAQKIMENAPPGSSNLTWNSGTLSNTELQIVSVLDRHKDQCPLSWGSLQDKANDPSTPPDLKAAIQGLQNDPQLFYAIGSQGDGRCGGKIKAGDLSSFSANHPQVASFKEDQASSYEENYIPSDATGNVQPSEMTESDAMRELYRYSDNLPKNLGLADFKQIVDGDAKTGKTPPQVIAAAKYFIDHPDQWKQVSGGNDEMSTADFLQAASSSMHMTQDELNTLDTINKNQKAFFGDGDLTRDKLTSMVNDKSLDPKVKQAASQLLSDPLLFGVLNNSITGYKTHHGFFNFGGGHTVDSGNISNDDFKHFYDNMSAANRTVQKPVTHAPKTAADQDAAADMMMGTADQPNIKTPKHNGGALMHALDEGLKIGSMVLDWGATALGALSFIPGIGELADMGSAVLEGESQAMNIARTVLDGGNLKKALEEAGLSMAAQAVGDIAGPEAKIAMRDGLAKTLIEKAATAGMNMPVQAAQYYAVSAMNNMKSRLEGNPTPGIFNFTQSMAEGGLGSLGEALDGIGGHKVKFDSMSDGIAKKVMEKATTATVNAPLTLAKGYAGSYLGNVQAQVGAGPAQPTAEPIQPTVVPTQTAPV